MTTLPDDARDLLSAYLDGEVTPEERAAVEERLADSPAWRDELAEVTVARDAVRGLELRDAPDGFWDAVFAHVEATDDGADVHEGPPPAATPIQTRRSRRVSRPVAWISGIAAAVALVVVVAAPGRDKVDPPVASMVQTHAARSSVSEDPISQLTPVALAGFRR